MAVGKCVVFFVVLTFLWTLNRAGAVDCVLKESCILPCTFQAGDEVVIHWIQVKAGDPRVHSFYHNQDQLSLQNERFRGRTSMYKDQISRGNASLWLTGVKIQDQGKYKCYTGTITGSQESFINLNVDAPVHKVDIQRVGNRITCSSEGIYPEPELTWSTNPPSNVTLQNKTTVHQTEQQLYNINSFLIVSGTDLVYSCTVSSRTNRRRATVLKPTSVNSSDTETIPCTSSNTPRTGLIWRFNHSHIILKETRANVPYTVSEEWRQQVKSVSDSGSLTLQHLTSNQEGIYTCELSDDEETYVTNTFLSIKKSEDNAHVAGIILGVVGAIIAIVLIFVFLVLYKKPKIPKKLRSKEKDREQNAGVPLKQSVVENNIGKNSYLKRKSCHPTAPLVKLKKMQDMNEHEPLHINRAGGKWTSPPGTEGLNETWTR